MLSSESLGCHLYKESIIPFGSLLISSGTRDNFSREDFGEKGKRGIL